MHDEPPRTPTRLLAAAGGTVGLVLLVRPLLVLAAVAPAFPRERAWLARALGARMLVQHAAVLVRPGSGVVTAGAALDLLHAASMGAARLAFPRLARPIGVSAASSVAAALAGVAAAGR